MSSFQQLVENSQVPSLLLFGPLALSFDQGALDRLCEVVSGNAEYSWILDTLASLPEHWESITASIPSLKQADPRLKKQLQDMRDTFQASKSWPDTGYPLPNTLLVPLAVAYQMTQYAAFINHTAGWTRLASADTETLGLCTGLLSAFAVSSAGGNKELFAKYGAVAMRLGLLVGMVVDEQDSLEPARSISVAWNSAEGGEEARRILALDEFQGVSYNIASQHRSHHPTSIHIHTRFHPRNSTLVNSTVKDPLLTGPSSYHYRPTSPSTSTRHAPP